MSKRITAYFCRDLKHDLLQKRWCLSACSFLGEYGRAVKLINLSELRQLSRSSLSRKVAFSSLLFSALYCVDIDKIYAEGWHSIGGGKITISSSETDSGIHQQSNGSSGGNLIISGAGTTVTITGKSKADKITNDDKSGTGSGLLIVAQAGQVSQLTIQNGAHLDIQSGGIDLYGMKDTKSPTNSQYGNGTENIIVGGDGSGATSVLELGTGSTSVQIGESGGSPDSDDTITIKKNGELQLDGKTHFGGYGTLVVDNGTIRLKSGSGELSATSRISMSNASITDSSGDISAGNSLVGDLSYTGGKNSYGTTDDIKSTGNNTLDIQGYQLTGNVHTYGNVNLIGDSSLNSTSLTISKGQLSLTGANGVSGIDNMVEEDGTLDLADSYTKEDAGNQKIPYAPQNYLSIANGDSISFKNGDLLQNDGGVTDKISITGTIKSLMSGTTIAGCSNSNTEACIGNTFDHMSIYYSEISGDTFHIESGQLYLSPGSYINDVKHLEIDKGAHLQLQSPSTQYVSSAENLKVDGGTIELPDASGLTINDTTNMTDGSITSGVSGATLTLDGTSKLTTSTIEEIDHLNLGDTKHSNITFTAEQQTDITADNFNLNSGSATFDASSLNLSGGATTVASGASLILTDGSTLETSKGINTVSSKGDISLNKSTLAASKGSSLTFETGSKVSMTSSEVTLGDGKGNKGNLTFSSGSTLDVEAGDNTVTSSTKTGFSDYGDLTMSNGSTMDIKDHGQLGVLGNVVLQNVNQKFNDSSVSSDLIDVSGDLTLGGTIDLSSPEGSSIQTGMYHLYNYGGKLIDPTGAKVTVTGLPDGDSATLETGTNGEVDVCVYTTSSGGCNVFQGKPTDTSTWSGSSITSTDSSTGKSVTTSTSDNKNPIVFGDNASGTTTKISIGSGSTASVGNGIDLGSGGYQIGNDNGDGTLTSSGSDSKDSSGKDSGSNGLNINIDKGSHNSKDATPSSITSNIGDGKSSNSTDSTKHTDVNVNGDGTLVIDHNGKEGYTGSTNVNGANLQIGNGTSKTDITNSSGTNITNGGSVTVNKNASAGSINSNTGGTVSIDGGTASSVDADHSSVNVGNGGTVSGTDKNGKSSTAVTAKDSKVTVSSGGTVGNVAATGSIVSTDGTTGSITATGSKVSVNGQSGSLNSTNSDTTVSKNSTVTGSVTASGGQTNIAGKIVPDKGTNGNGNSDNSGSLTVNNGGTATLSGSVSGDLNVGSSGVDSSNTPSSVTMDHGSVGGNATIGSKSSLSGSGTVKGNVSVGSGGSINITGTGNPNDGQTKTDNGSGINVGGNLTMGDGSSITANGSGTSVQVGGTATVGNVTVHETGVNRGDLTPDTKHNQVIVHSGGSITDNGSITVDGMGPLVSWTTGVTDDPNGGHDITITYSGKSYSSIGGTGDQVSVGHGLDGLGAAGQSITIPLGAIGTVDGLRKAYSALSGEINADARTAMINNSYTLQEAAIGRLDCLNDDIRKKTFGSQVVKNNYCGIDPKHPFTVWGRAFGTKGDSFANSGTGIATMSQSTAGWIMGADAQMAGTWRVGGLISYGRDWYGAGDGLMSSGRSNDISLGMYAGNAWQMNNSAFDAALTLKLGAIYTWNIMHNRREVNFSGYDGILSSNALGGTFQGFTELGYKMMFDKKGKMPMEIEPFVRMSFVNFNTDNYAEHGATAALLVQGEDTTVGYVDMGVKAATSVQVGKNGAFSPHMALSYRRAFGDTNTSIREAFAAAHSSDYNMAIDGVPIAVDTADVNIGATVRISDRLDFDADYIGQYGNHITASGGLGTIKYHF